MTLSQSLLQTVERAKELSGNQYARRSKEAQELIKATMKKNNCSELEAAWRIANFIEKKWPNNQPAKALFVAAAVEMGRK